MKYMGLKVNRGFGLYLLREEMKVWDGDGLHERAVGGHPDFDCVGSECQDVGRHVHCVCVREGGRERVGRGHGRKRQVSECYLSNW